MAQLLIDVVGVGSGPLGAAGSWEWSWELDRAGPISFPISAADAQARHLDTDREVRAYLLRDGAARLDVGAGIVEELGDEVQRRGVARRTVQGSDLLIELTDRTVGTLNLVGVTTAAAVAAIMAFAPDAGLPGGWTADTTTYATSGHTISIQFAGESVLAALGKVAELSGEHFRLGDDRELVWLFSQQPVSGVRAVQDGDGVALRNNPRVCLIRRLKRVKDSAGTFTRIYAYGNGNADARLTMAGATWSPPVGYAFGPDNAYLVHTASDTAKRKDKVGAFKDIEAADTLAQAAYEQLRRHIEAQQAYDLEVTKLDMPVRPGETIRVVYLEFSGTTRTLDIDDDLHVLAVKTRVDKNGRSRVVGLTVATIDRWPKTDTELLIGALSQAASMESHVQPAVTAQSAANIADLSVTTSTIVDGNVTPAKISALVYPLTKTVAPITFVNTMAENTLFSYSVPGGTLGTANKLRLVLQGKFFNNSGTNYAPRIRIYFGATTIYDDQPTAVATNAAARPWQITCDLTASGATNSQVALSTTLVGAQNGVAGVTVANSALRHGLHESVAEDSTLAKTLSVTVTLPVAHANLSFTAHNVFLELLRS